jgi:hypothetical protein
LCHWCGFKDGEENTLAIRRMTKRLTIFYKTLQCTKSTDWVNRPLVKQAQWFSVLAKRESLPWNDNSFEQYLYLQYIKLLLMGKINKFFYGYISFLVSLVYDV